MGVGERRHQGVVEPIHRRATREQPADTTLLAQERNGLPDADPGRHPGEATALDLTWDSNHHREAQSLLALTHDPATHRFWIEAHLRCHVVSQMALLSKRCVERPV